MYKVAFIGSGGRSSVYLRNYAPETDIEVVAVADPDAHNRRAMPTRAQVDADWQEFDDWRDMLTERKDLDGVVIATPNYHHADPAVACYERGLPIALEKPLAVTQTECERILDAELSNNGRTVLGFVLRSAPFYRTIHDLIHEGAVGKLVSIQAGELPGPNVSAVVCRGSWRSRRATCGGLMLEKCCHDMDLFNWMMGCRPVAVSSHGGLRMFSANPTLPMSCDDCGAAAHCLYYQEPAPSVSEDASEAVLTRFLKHKNACVYNTPKDIFDTQAVTVEYENGGVVSFLLQFNCFGPRCGRDIHAIGQKGRLWGAVTENVVHHHDNLSRETRDLQLELDGSGHGGGDRAHCLELRKMMADPEYRPAPGVYAGYLSAMVCFAADLSLIERRRVDFDYDDVGRATLV